MHLKTQSVVLAAAMLFCAAAPPTPAPPTAPAAAQTWLVSGGQGSYLALGQESVLNFKYSVKQVNGVVQGFAEWRGPNSVIVWQVSSVTFIGDSPTLAFAGPIVEILGTPPTGYAVGLTAFSAVTDDWDDGSVESIASISVVPPLFGNPTIQQIIAGFGPPPAGAFRPLASGYIWIQ